MFVEEKNYCCKFGILVLINIVFVQYSVLGGLKTSMPSLCYQTILII